MGFMLPSPESPRERARTLMSRKDGIEAEITAQVSILKAHSCDMTTPLVDREGFPRADLDIYAIRQARVRIIELRNDLKDVMNEIGKALEQVYDPALAPPPTAGASSETPSDSSADAEQPSLPFAKVDGVAPGSPAAEAVCDSSGLLREDMITKFGHLTKASFSASSLQPLAELVNISENRELQVQVFREGQEVSLKFTPRKGWGGRGMLGCHIVPYAES
ncbi:hypothetical protein HYDPIDRAFT_135775 [Hydnomerulius pinastri MD-312]|uniref:Probable 26S proteasome regulatory subunit p27 n=1 Tax=Hydnomerulius pinastri MD-312 TaxID=994086 RepID=A0A0C9VWT0_9AGAM|nr:hypothetical protein HYDPIDRAFT_135775 [Hydnomerulius pinastri MD-312]